MRNHTATLTIDTLAAHFRSYSLLLAHPDASHQSLLLATLLNNPPCPVYFHQIGMGITNLDQFLTDWVRDVADQAPTFGRLIHQVRSQHPGDVNQFAQAMADELYELEKVDYLLIISEYDRADGIWDIQAFMEILLRILPAQCHLFITSRTMPPMPWVSLIARNRAAILREDGTINTGLGQALRP